MWLVFDKKKKKSIYTRLKALHPKSNKDTSTHTPRTHSFIHSFAYILTRSTLSLLLARPFVRLVVVNVASQDSLAWPKHTLKAFAVQLDALDIA